MSETQSDATCQIAAWRVQQTRRARTSAAEVEAGVRSTEVGTFFYCNLRLYLLPRRSGVATVSRDASV